jgi:hypothetical protein
MGAAAAGVLGVDGCKVQSNCKPGEQSMCMCPSLRHRAYIATLSQVHVTTQAVNHIQSVTISTQLPHIASLPSPLVLPPLHVTTPLLLSHSTARPPLLSRLRLIARSSLSHFLYPTPHHRRQLMKHPASFWSSPRNSTQTTFGETLFLSLPPPPSSFYLSPCLQPLLCSLILLPPSSFSLAILYTRELLRRTSSLAALSSSPPSQSPSSSSPPSVAAFLKKRSDSTGSIRRCVHWFKGV